VESNGFREDQWLDTVGNPLTSTGRVTERFRRPNYGTMEIEITINEFWPYAALIARTSKSLCRYGHAGFDLSREQKDIEHLPKVISREWTRARPSFVGLAG
jgi:hypothetical protein